jgi:membrane protein DedA with SNARE-associated domain
LPDTSALTIYLGVFAALVAAGFGFPMPEELPIVTAGALVGRESNDPTTALHWWVLLPLCVAGVVLSDGLLYWIGRMWGVRLLRFRPVARVLPPERLERTQALFHRHGVWILLAARLLPGFRSPIFLTAGIMRLSWRRFLLADGLYALPGVTLLFFLSYWLTDTFREWVVAVEEQVSRARLLVVVIAVGVTLVYGLIRWMRRRRERGGETSEEVRR